MTAKQLQETKMTVSQITGKRTIWFYSLSSYFSLPITALASDHASPKPPTLIRSISLVKPYVTSSHSQTSLINTTVSCMVTKPRLPLREGDSARLDPGRRAWEGFVEDWRWWWGLMFLFSFCFECPCTPFSNPSYWAPVPQSPPNGDSVDFGTDSHEHRTYT